MSFLRTVCAEPRGTVQYSSTTLTNKVIEKKMDAHDICAYYCTVPHRMRLILRSTVEVKLTLGMGGWACNRDGIFGPMSRAAAKWKKKSSLPRLGITIMMFLASFAAAQGRALEKRSRSRC